MTISHLYRVVTSVMRLALGNSFIIMIIIQPLSQYQSGLVIHIFIHTYIYSTLLCLITFHNLKKIVSNKTKISSSDTSVLWILKDKLSNISNFVRAAFTLSCYYYRNNRCLYMSPNQLGSTKTNELPYK